MEIFNFFKVYILIVGVRHLLHRKHSIVLLELIFKLLELFELLFFLYHRPTTKK